MQTKFRLLLLWLLCLTSNFILAQGKDDRYKIRELFQKSFKVYEAASIFQLKMEYKLYTTYKSNTISEKYNGNIIKKNADYYSKIDNTEFIKIKTTHIKIDNQSKLMEVDEDQNAGNQPPVYNMKTMLANFNVFKLEEDKDFYICTLTAPALSMVPYGKAIIYLNKRNCTIARQVLYLLVQNSYKNVKGKDTIDYPRLEVTFSGFDTKSNIAPTLFAAESYIRIKNKTAVPAGNYKDYKIVD